MIWSSPACTSISNNDDDDETVVDFVEIVVESSSLSMTHFPSSFFRI